jgi:hypothetical protein
MLRVLIGTGLLLMAVGFGAAGWQYWQTLPKAAVAEEAATATPVPPLPARQSWLISPTGGLVPQADVQAYLAQERFVPARTLRVVRQAKLADLLVGEEKLPDAPFLEVLADIRAPKVGDGLCQVLLDAIARDCAVNAARVVEGSVDPAVGTAMFQLELVFRLQDDGTELPDLATRVLHTDRVKLDMEAGTQGTETPDAALKALLETIGTACGDPDVGEVCRPLRLTLDWVPDRPVSAGAEVAWLAPLPKGMFVAPPLDPAIGG